MTEQSPRRASNGWRDWLTAGRVLIIGLVGVIVVLGLILIITAVEEADRAAEGRERVDALASSDDDCVKCHRNTTPGIVQQYGFSPWPRRT